MNSTHTLPFEIRRAIRNGMWPREWIPAACLRPRLGTAWDVDLELIQDEKLILEGGSNIADLGFLFSCCDNRAGEMFRVHKGSTQPGRSELPWLDVERAVVLGGGATPGDDCWLVLDYRLSQETPRVLVNVLQPQKPTQYAWVVLADSATDFLDLIAGI